MRRATILGLLISILVCLQSRLICSKNSNGTTHLRTCKSNATDDYFPRPKSAIIQNISRALWICVATTAILCNALIIHVVRVNKHMHTTTNYLIVNMAVGDTLAIILTTVISFYNSYYGNRWVGDEVFGEHIFCRMKCPLYYFCMLFSIYSLVVISFDRFLAVTRPLKYKHRSSWSKYTIPCIWMTSLAVASHYALREIDFCSSEGELYCVPVPSVAQAFLMLFLGFILPHFVMFTLYIVIAFTLCTRKVPGEHAQNVSGQTSSEKFAKKVTLMIVCILVAFDVAYVPIFLAFLFPYLYTGGASDSFIEVWAYKMLLITNGISNSLIYAVFNGNFKQAFKKALSFNRFMIALGKVKRRSAGKGVSRGPCGVSP